MTSLSKRLSQDALSFSVIRKLLCKFVRGNSEVQISDSLRDSVVREGGTVRPEQRSIHAVCQDIVCCSKHSVSLCLTDCQEASRHGYPAARMCLDSHFCMRLPTGPEQGLQRIHCLLQCLPRTQADPLTDCLQPLFVFFFTIVENWNRCSGNHMPVKPKYLLSGFLWRKFIDPQS